MTDTDLQTRNGTASGPLPSDGENGRSEIVDFKMVTFSLGGKDYGIDIMQVKEIAKFHQFTYVPNTAPYVRGVYNLRGEIISIIDLRLLFNLPVDNHESGRPENGLILRLENNVIGVIVDSIDRVVGLSSSLVQPPHPIFADINIKYIQGVAQYDNRLYIILDAERVFEKPTETDASRAESRYTSAPIRDTAATAHDAGTAPPSAETQKTAVEDTFVAQGLETFAGFVVSPINDRWYTRRLDEWKTERRNAGKEMQFGEQSDADSFLRSFYSRRSGAFLDEDYGSAIVQAMERGTDGIIQVWNPGTGGGYEAYSIAGLLMTHYAGRQVKIWAGDNDLLKISNAPNMVFEERDVPEYLRKYLVAGSNGYTFSEEFQNAILFEFSDIRNSTGIPRVDAIVARDVVSFLSRDVQERVFEAFEEKIKPGGILVLGDRERPLNGDVWSVVSENGPSIFRIR